MAYKVVANTETRTSNPTFYDLYAKAFNVKLSQSL